ncbi:putative disease resistance protein RGA3 [Impatiens glandulifera]|uniref:putative disease resistance protein RGA3 n=1 Tax=Impatiens glandulifera TaxID=253017 RepID=UPI001FB0E647|nr:putative disease resistance protein RGA3 [Impatiens glandulifera]
MVDAALISGLLSNLVPLIKDEFSLFWSFQKEVQKLSSTLSSINAVLEDAERKNLQEKDKQMEDWLRKLKNVAYEVRDIMDDCTFQDLRLQLKRLNASSSTRIKVTNSIIHPFSSTWTRLKVGHKIKDAQEKLDQISSERQKLHLCESIHDSKIDKFTSNWRETMSLSSCNQVYGRDKEKKQIVDILVNNSSSACVDKKLSVLSIVGIGGLGKTTLAQMVFNDEEISKHFDTKIWVCVSDEFDIKLVIKAIIGTTNETSLEILQKMIQEKLKGKKYLIVLDDVWNENVEAWDQLRSILDCGSNGAFVLTTTRKRNVARIMETIEHFQLSGLSNNDCWLLLEERAFMCGTPKTPNFVDIGKEIVKKCKGVPLVAKTLGSQLGFKSDSNEWRKIRDSKIWEIFQNEESDLLPILRLSYYDLPYHLRRCFVFCAIFPKDTVIEKERLIQLWMAHDLIPTFTNQSVEDIGNTIWKELCWRSFFQDDNLNWIGLHEICNMHDLMYELAQSVMKDECYTLDANSSNDGIRLEIRHLAVKVDEFFKTSFHSLMKIGGLQSIMLHGKFTKKILSFLRELPSLRVLGVIHKVQYQDLRYVGCLKHLRYLDISGSTQITTLPDSICDLLNLQTLKLNECSNLESLPRHTKDLVSLRHLYLKGCHRLKYMPRGMGQLKHLKTLNLFVISKKERDGQLDELRELDIGGSLEIKNLGRVSDASIARGTSMAKKTSIDELKLDWRSYDEDDESKSIRHEIIGEALEVSTARLKILRMIDYKGMNLPKWVGKSSPSLTRLVLRDLDNVNTIASSRDAIEMTVLFPLLEELEINGMMNLRELVSPSCWSTGAFPNLCRLDISNCPNLGRLPPHLKALKDVTVLGECSEELLYSIGNLNGLTRLELKLSRLNNNVEHIFTVNNNMNEIEVVLFPLLKELVIDRMMNLRELVSPAILSPKSFSSLCKIEISYCPNLGALPLHLKSLKDVSVFDECSDELLYSISNLSALTHLSLYMMNERSVLFPAAKPLMFDVEIQSSSSTLADNNEAQIGVRSTFQSLQSLSMWYCNKLRSLFDEGMIMQDTLKISASQNQQNHDHHLQGQTERTRGLINSLTELFIYGCPELMISVEEFENLNMNNSLQRLTICDCPKLVSSEEADDFIALLCSLRTRLGRENFNVDILLEKKDEEHCIVAI